MGWSKRHDPYSNPRTDCRQRRSPAPPGASLGERVVTLSVISDIVSQDAGLKTHVLQLARDCAPSDETDISVDECIVEIGIERLRESLRQTRFWLKAN